MRIRTKIFIGYFILVAAGFYFFAKWMRDDVRRHYLESIEETMVDTANILAGFAESDIRDGAIDIERLRRVFEEVKRRQLSAVIYELPKAVVDMDVYVTDQNGIVLFDSGEPNNRGKDFSRWNDVYLSLRKRYGARATRRVEDDPTSTILYISAPIFNEGRSVGVVTVYKPVKFISLFIANAKREIFLNAIWAGLVVFVLGLILSAWLTEPFTRLRDYVLDLKAGRNPSSPNIGKGEASDLERAFEEMREALEGKRYVERYVQHLTHELKSPIAAIKGAMEFFEDLNLTGEKRERLIRNINIETDRMNDLVERMLQLSCLENRRKLEDGSHLDLVVLLKELVANYGDTCSDHFFSFKSEKTSAMIWGERFLLYQAFDNLIRNAVDFSPSGSKITVGVSRLDENIVVRIEDEGAGIPEYGIEKVFDKFYSLPRPNTGKKSSGLGLSIVKAIVELHRGRVTLENRKERGVAATVFLK